MSASKNEPDQKVEFSTAEFDKLRDQYHLAVDRLLGISAGHRGSKVRHGREYWASILTSKLCVTSMTLDKILPKKPHPESEELWDLSSVASLVRVLIENYLLMYWLCLTDHNEDTWQFKITALTIMDNRARFRMMHEIEGAEEPDEFIQSQEALIEMIEKTTTYQNLTDIKQREVCRGNKLPYIQDDVIEALTMEKTEFRRIYRYFSAFVHTGTVSFFRMEKQQRGDGGFNVYDAGGILAALALAELTLRTAASDLLVLFENSRLPGLDPGSR